MLRVLPILFAGVALAGCTHEFAGPQFSLEGLPDGLAVEFTVEPAEVRQHEPFSARLTVTNSTTQTIQVVTTHGCLAVPGVIRNGQRIPFKGSWWGCTAAITGHTFAPGETRSHTWHMRAELAAQHPGDVEGAPAPKATYRVQAEFHMYSENGPVRKPLVESPLVVR